MRVGSVMLLSVLLVSEVRGQLPSADPPPIDTPSWLAGCWRLERRGTVVDEQWLAPLGGMMLGQSRTVRNGVVVEYESVIIRAEVGGLSYEAHPSGQAAATFRALMPGGEDDVLFVTRSMISRNRSGTAD